MQEGVLSPFLSVSIPCAAISYDFYISLFRRNVNTPYKPVYRVLPGQHFQGKRLKNALFMLAFTPSTWYNIYVYLYMLTNEKPFVFPCKGLFIYPFFRTAYAFRSSMSVISSQSSNHKAERNETLMPLFDRGSYKLSAAAPP